MFGICNLAIIPLRFEPNDRSEIVSQVLFGEHFEILEQEQWSRIKMHFDGYEGWVDSNNIKLFLNQTSNFLTSNHFKF
jgi:SH3-like domain-containing protein